MGEIGKSKQKQGSRRTWCKRFEMFNL